LYIAEIARSGFSFDTSSYPVKMDSIDKARLPVRAGRKREESPQFLQIWAVFDVELNMEDIKGYEGPEKRVHPRFPTRFPAFLRFSVTREGNPTILELDGETIDISLEGAKLSLPQKPDAVSSIEDAKEGRGVDVGVEIFTEKKMIEALGDVRWFKVEAPERVTVGIHLKGMGRDDREIWEDVVKSAALSL
jgi:hypothetical protein